MNIQRKLIAPPTIARVNAEDKSASSKEGMCTFYDGYKFRPKWDTSELVKEISLFSPPNNYPDPSRFDFMIVIRAYSLFTNHILSMIYSFESQSSTSSVNFQVFIIPTDEESLYTIKQDLVKKWFNSTVKRQIQVTLVEFPSWIYKHYGSYIDNLCTDSWIQIALKKYSQSDINRYYHHHYYYYYYYYYYYQTL